MPFHASGVPGEALNAPALRDQESSKPEPTVGLAPLLPRRPAPRVPAIKKPTLRRTGKVRTCHVSPLLLGCSDVSLDKNYVSDESGLFIHVHDSQPRPHLWGTCPAIAFSLSSLLLLSSRWAETLGISHQDRNSLEASLCPNVPFLFPNQASVGHCIPCVPVIPICVCGLCPMPTVHVYRSYLH